MDSEPKLKTEFRRALDDVLPPVPWLEAAVVEDLRKRRSSKSTSVAEGATRLRRERLMFRLRAPLSGVAVLVVIAVVVAALFVGRLTAGFNAFHNGQPADQIPLSQVAQLEASPLHIPTPASHADCKSGPYNSVGDLAAGPVYGVGSGPSFTSWGSYYHNLAYAQTDITGPILVRGIDVFTHKAVVFVGQYAAGPIVGHDTLGGVAVEQHAYLLFDTSQASTNPIHKFEWPFIAGVPNGYSGSTGWQIDGIGFSETFLVC